jgi:aromatic-L-amino-acid/L-tryptophan decarboxylase
MDAEDFKRHGHALVDWIANYLDHPERYPVLAQVHPGDVRAALPSAAPDQPQPFEEIFADFERVLLPALTHWNHPGFFAYFAISSSPVAVLAEFLAAALNQQAMLWRTSPAATELEEVSLAWLRQLLGLPDTFEGVIYDTASVSTLHGLAAAREAAIDGVRRRGLAARGDLAPPRVYCSEHAHSSVEKAIILLGLGQDALRRIPADDDHAMRVDVLEDAIDRDRAEGALPIAIVATLGTTSTTSCDPVQRIADVCARRDIWLHVDAAYAGVAAMLPDQHHWFAGWERADSVVVNPHKWLFVPVDLSAFYCRRMDVVRRAFSLVPDYLETPDAERGARNLMDTGIQLGRRFRALKLWMVLREFGTTGIQQVLTRHIHLAQEFAAWVDAHPAFERVAPVPFSVVCFRARPHGVDEGQLDALNEHLLTDVNASGEVFLSHTRLNGRLALRLAIGNLRTTEDHVSRAWELLQQALSHHAGGVLPR